MSLQLDAAGGPMAAFAGRPDLFAAPPKPKRDLKKTALIVGLSVLAWVSTYTGMLELIQANLGDVGMVEKVATGLAVAMLQIMIVWLLDQLFSPIHASIKLFYMVGYLFLTLISVGFAFGFYWKVLESRSASTSSAESSIGGVQSALRGAETRLDQLVSTLETLTGISTSKADLERASGNSCPGSKPGAGPRMAMRQVDSEKFSFASKFVKGRSEQVKGDIKALDVDLQRILKDDKSIVDAKSGNRNEFLKGMGRKLDDTTTRYNALRTDPQLRQIRMDAAERAEKTSFADTRGGTYACPDGQMQSALRGVVAAIDQLPQLEKPKIAATEGSEAVIEAFRRLTMTIGGAMTFKLPPTPEELREKQAKAIQAMESPAAAAASQKALNLESAGLGKRDYIPLGIAIFVDFCLLMVSFGRPMDRFARTALAMKAAQAGPQGEMVRTTREIHEDSLVRRDFELLQHVVIHFGNHYLAAVPLTAPHQSPDGRELSPEERSKLMVEAQTLVTLFSGLELNNAIVDRGLPPTLLLLGGSARVRSRLLKQESKFARAGAFRFYRFRNRAWPEMILGSVMSAAKHHHAKLTQRRAEDEADDQENRKLEAEQRKAGNAKRAAENAQRIAEAELATIEAQLRQREIEGQLREASQLRGQQQRMNRGMGPGMGPAGGPAAAPIGGPRGPIPGPGYGGPGFGGPSFGPGSGGPGGPGSGGPGYGPQNAAGTAPGSAPHPSFAPQSHPMRANGGAMPAAVPHAYAPATFIEPANHNTAPSPADRMRAAMSNATNPTPIDARPLPHNVVPLPDRSERLPQERGLAIDNQAALPSAATLDQGPMRANPVPMPTADLGSLLRKIGVRQLQAAREVADVVQQIEGGPSPQRYASTADDKAAIDRAAIDRAAIDAPLFEVSAVEVPTSPAVGRTAIDRRLSNALEEGLPVREAQAWREAGSSVLQDMREAYAGRAAHDRGLAHDPGLDDATTIAARYAPTPRPH